MHTDYSVYKDFFYPSKDFSTSSANKVKEPTLDEVKEKIIELATQFMENQSLPTSLATIKMATHAMALGMNHSVFNTPEGKKEFNHLLGRIVPFLDNVQAVITRDPYQLEAQDTLKYMYACTHLIHKHKLTPDYSQPQTPKSRETSRS